MVSQRQLGLFSAASLVVASMIGSGVFTTSGFLVADLHTPGRVLIAWLLGGILALFGALCYGALARRFPESGGEYIFLARTLHPAAGYLAGWVSLLVGFSAPLAAAALAFGEYTKPWFPNPILTASCLVVAFAVLHALHIQRGAWIQNIAVVAKVLLIAVLLGWAGSKLKAQPVATPGDFPVADFAVSLVWISFSYSGWNAAVYIAGEIRNPDTSLPLALLTATGLVTLLYLGLNAVFLYSAPVESFAGKVDIGRIAAEAIGGATLANFVTALIALALATSVSSMIMAGPRVFARMASDGFLPQGLAFRENENEPPRLAILLQTTLALIMLWTTAFRDLLTYIGFTLGLCTAAAVVGLIRLRLREGPQIRVPGWPWVPIIFILGVGAITVFTITKEPKASGVGLATLAFGWVVWWLHPGKGRDRGVS